MKAFNVRIEIVGAKPDSKWDNEDLNWEVENRQVALNYGVSLLEVLAADSDWPCQLIMAGFDEWSDHPLPVAELRAAIHLFAEKLAP